MFLRILLLFCIDFSLVWSQDICDPSLIKLKSHLSKRIVQGLHHYHDLQAQARSNTRRIKKMFPEMCVVLKLEECFVEQQLSTLHDMILHYQSLSSGVKSGDDFGQLDARFDHLRGEIERHNRNCVETMANLCC